MYAKRESSKNCIFRSEFLAVGGFQPQNHSSILFQIEDGARKAKAKKGWNRTPWLLARKNGLVYVPQIFLFPWNIDWNRLERASKFIAVNFRSKPVLGARFNYGSLTLESIFSPFFPWAKMYVNMERKMVIVVSPGISVSEFIKSGLFSLCLYGCIMDGSITIMPIKITE